MNKFTKILIGSLFILSGVTSLVYESLWIRALSLSLGSTSTSMSLVLSIFFFGMSMGSYLSGSMIHKIKNPLRTYGIIEGLIGIYAFGLIYALTNLSAIVTYIPGTHSSSFLAMTFKGALVMLVLGPPTIAMGATLPLLIKTLSDPKTGVGKNVSLLYAVNTIGAVIGAFSAGFILIPKSGVIGANHLMVGLNLLILVICYLLANKVQLNLVRKSDVHHGPVKLSNMSPINKTIVLSSGLVGLASIGSEVIWNKYLGMFLGTNIFGLSLVLAIFLFGIATGSYLLSLFIDKINNKVALYINLLVATIVSVLLATWGLNWAPVAANIFNYYFPAFDLLTVKSIVATAILIIPTGFFGALLPLAVNLVTIDEDSAAAVTGKVYAVNTWGAIIGSALTGLWLIPTFGSGVALIILNSVLILALIMVLYHGFLYQEYRFLGPMKLAACLALIFFVPTVKFNHIIKSAYFSYLTPGLGFEEVVQFFNKDYEKIVYLEEGKTAIISLNHEENEFGETNPKVFRMKTNGLNESYYDRDYLDVIPKYEGLLGLVPFLHVENAEKAFIVGYGGGYTTDLLTSLDIPLVHVAEIEESVLKIADYIYEGDNPIVKRKNLKLEIEDARFVLNAKKHGPYDIIVSQPSHSWISGVANLFTKDFFEIAKSNLTENGVFAQWLNLYNMDEGSLKSILHTYYKTFPHGVVYTDETDYQVILLGSNNPLKLNRTLLKKMADNSDWQRRLSFLPFENEYDFLSNFSMGRDKILATTKGAPLNTDENAFAEIRQSSLFYTVNSEAMLTQPYFSDNFDTDLGKSIPIVEKSKVQFIYGLLKSLGRQQKFDKYFKLIKKYEKLMTSTPQYAHLLAELCSDIERIDCAIQYNQQAFQQDKTPERLFLLLSSLNFGERYTEVIRTAILNKKHLNMDSQCAVYRAKIETDQTPKLILKQPSFLISQCGSPAQDLVAKVQMKKKNYNEAIETLEPLVDSESPDIRLIGLMIEAQLKLKRYASVSYYSDLFKEQQQSEMERISNLADYYREMGWEEDSKKLSDKIGQLEI